MRGLTTGDHAKLCPMRCAWLGLLVIAACNAGPFDRDRCEQIVTRVRALAIVPAQIYRFRVDDDLEPSSLAPVPDRAMLGRGDGRGLVRAKVDAGHRLAVSIETRDDGHAGEYGFMFTDDGLAGTDLEFVQLDSQHEQRIDDRWVRWHYDMD